jgi:hypothetical protein
VVLGVDSASNRNEYQESSWGIKGGRQARKDDNLTAICEPIVCIKCGSLDVSKPYGPPRTSFSPPFPDVRELGFGTLVTSFGHTWHRANGDPCPEMSRTT